jgi:alkanesulfonate monooxygenase SsuD/methylene tetrahydromethanopterin reductase-like flavin-dependent oxidoreductase (luciferase family)
MQVTGNLHFCYEVWESAGRSDQHIPPHFADVWAEYVEHVEKIPLAPEARHLRIHEGHATYLLDAERRFVRPLGIRASCVVGDPDEIAWQLEAMGRVGVTDIALVPPADRQLEVFRDFAAQVLPRFH